MTGESDLNNYIDLLQGIQEIEYAPRLKVIDKILCAHFGIAEFTYEWNCVFPESATQRQDRECKLLESIAKLVEDRIISPEAAHKIMVDKGLFTVEQLGSVPTQIPVGNTKEKK